MKSETTSKWHTVHCNAPCSPTARATHTLGPLVAAAPAAAAAAIAAAAAGSSGPLHPELQPNSSTSSVSRSAVHDTVGNIPLPPPRTQIPHFLA